MDLNQIFEEQQNATKWKMAIYSIRKDWLSKRKNAKWKLSERCTEVLEIVNTPRQWPHIGEKHYVWQDSTKIFWNNIAADINEYVKSCQQCQNQGNLKSLKVELKSIPVLSSVMKQVAVDICNLPEVHEYRHFIILTSETDQGQTSTDYRSIFVRGDVSAWVLWNPNQRPRSRVCNWSMQTSAWINWRRTESYISLSPSGEMIGRTSKPNNKELFGKDFGR